MRSVRKAANYIHKYMYVELVTSYKLPHIVIVPFHMVRLLLATIRFLAPLVNTKPYKFAHTPYLIPYVSAMGRIQYIISYIKYEILLI